MRKAKVVVALRGESPFIRVMQHTVILSPARVDEEINRGSAKIAKLESELKTAKVEAERLTLFRNMVVRFGHPTDGSEWPEPANENMRLPRPGSKAATIGDASVKLIRESGRAQVLIGEMLSSLKSMGIEISGENESGYLAGVLSRDPRVVYDRPHGWRLASFDVPSDKSGMSQEAADEAGTQTSLTIEEVLG